MALYRPKLAPPQRFAVTVDEAARAVTLKAFGPDGSVAWEETIHPSGDGVRYAAAHDREIAVEWKGESDRVAFYASTAQELRNALEETRHALDKAIAAPSNPRECWQDAGKYVVRPQPPRKETPVMSRLAKLFFLGFLFASGVYVGTRGNEARSTVDTKMVELSLTKAEELKALAQKVERLRANPATAALADAAQADYERLAAEVRGEAARTAAEGALREDQAAQEAAARRDALGRSFERGE